MISDREVTHVVRAWLQDGMTELPSRVMDGLLEQLSVTPQRHGPWPTSKAASRAPALEDDPCDHGRPGHLDGRCGLPDRPGQSARGLPGERIPANSSGHAGSVGDGGADADRPDTRVSDPPDRCGSLRHRPAPGSVAPTLDQPAGAWRLGQPRWLRGPSPHGRPRRDDVGDVLVARPGLPRPVPLARSRATWRPGRSAVDAFARWPGRGALGLVASEWRIWSLRADVTKATAPIDLQLAGRDAKYVEVTVPAGPRLFRLRRRRVPAVDGRRRAIPDREAGRTGRASAGSSRSAATSWPLTRATPRERPRPT